MLFHNALKRKWNILALVLFIDQCSTSSAPAESPSSQIIVEKLLRDCPDIKNVYFLARGRKGASAEQRVSELLDSQVITDITFSSNHSS